MNKHKKAPKEIVAERQFRNISERFNKKLIRKNFREKVLKRDGYKCAVCNRKDLPLDAHHIIDRNEIKDGGYILENGISLCKDCHLKAEVYHESGKTKWVPGYRPDDLFQLIKG